jgi:hypothetical protein
MKKYNLLLCVFVLLSINVFGQKKYRVSAKVYNESKTNSNDSKIKAIYYFTDSKPDSIFFTKDSLFLSKRMINKDFPILTLFNDYNFRFEYSYKYDTVKLVSPNDNSVIVKIVKTAQNVEGDWITTDLQKNVSLIFRKELKVNYGIVESDNLVYFIKINK